MKTLLIETSGRFGGVGVACDDQLLKTCRLSQGLVHGQALLPTIDELWRTLGWQPAQMELIIVVQGPGSYTGIRVGVATAKTLAYALQLPVVPISTLDLLAHNAAPFPGTICPVIDARRQQVYAALYQNSSGTLIKSQPEQALPLSQLLAQAPRPLMIYGNKLTNLLERAGKLPVELKEVTVGEEKWAQPDIEILLKLGRQALQAGRAQSAHQLYPLYLRPSEAELNWQKKTKR